MASGKTVNPEIDKAVAKLMKQIGGKEVPLETQVKVLNSAIAWEKTKAQISESSDADDWDPDQIFGD